MDILDQIQHGPFTDGPTPEWAKRGQSFLDSFPIKESWERGWKVADLQWDSSIEMYAIIDTEGSVRGWIGEQALQAMRKLAEEVG